MFYSFFNKANDLKNEGTIKAKSVQIQSAL